MRRLWLLPLLTCLAGCLFPLKVKQIGDSCEVQCGSFITEFLFECRSDCAGDLVCEVGTCRSTCKSDADCPETCNCLSAQFVSDDEDYPASCRGDTVCGDKDPRCDRLKQNCSQDMGERSCYYVSSFKDACLPPGQGQLDDICNFDEQCGAGLGCLGRGCYRYCSNELPCPGGMGCLEGFCLAECDLWTPCMQRVDGGPASAGIRECRPTTMGRPYCVPYAYAYRDTCTTEYTCYPGDFCTGGLCERLCDQDHDTCGSDGGCEMYPDAGYGHCVW